MIIFDTGKENRFWKTLSLVLQKPVIRAIHKGSLMRLFPYDEIEIEEGEANEAKGEA